ncbi:type VII secretion system-associated protein [Streptomyces mexicanus]|uniref:type VII secretion system-associated protein n=1 Tax=Streptomyces mexicanus TaxID=178566 RepID=UPI0031E9D551
MSDLTHLDLKELQSFHDHEADDALKAARSYRNDDAHGVRPLGHLVDGHNTPDNLAQDQQLLRIGDMATKTLVSGPTLLDDVKTAATAIDKLLADQETFFTDLKDALQQTIDKMKKTNQQNLDAIDAQTLLQIFSDVDTDTSGQSGSTQGTGGSTDSTSGSGSTDTSGSGTSQDSSGDS